LSNCPREYCNYDQLNEHSTEWSKTSYCENCGYYEEIKYDSPQKTYNRSDVVYEKREKKKKPSKKKF